MSTNGGRLNGWAKVLAVAIPLAVAGLVGFGMLKSDVEHAASAIQQKANAETVNAQYEAILRELQGVNRRLDRLEAR